MNTRLLILSISGLFLLVLFILFIESQTITDPNPESCTIVETKIINVTEGSSYDIVFLTKNQESFYINRGLERGLNLDSLRGKIINKTVTLYLVDLPLGTSKHIAQLTAGKEVLFTEFK